MTSYDEKFLVKVFDSVTDPFVIYDREFRILRVNQALLTLFKLPAEKVIGRYCYELFYDRTAICEECHVKEVFEYGESRMLEKHIPLPDGSKRVFEVNSYPIIDEKGMTIQAIEYARDITDRKITEKALWATEERFRYAFENANIGICLVDTKGCFLRVNNRMCEIFGYSQEELEGMAVNYITHPGYIDVSTKFIQRALSGEIDFAEFEKKYHHKNGQVIWGYQFIDPRC